MDDPNNELNQIGRNPRFVGQLKKRKRTPEDEANNVDDRFTQLKKQTKLFRDKRGRPWVKNPLEYAKDLLEKDEEEDEDQSESEQDKMDTDESVSDSEDATSDSGSKDDYDDGGGPGPSMLENEEFADIGLDNLSKDAPLVEEATYRLAVVHFDWDKSKVEDLFLVLESFLPNGGAIKKITLYPSQFGMERMSEENEQGPRELRTAAVENSSEQTGPDNPDGDNSDGPDSENVSKAARRRLREYQLSRLKYFYGIIEFDSVETSSSVYDQCDGLEYENSGIRLDLRFVNDEETFETPPEWQHLVSSVTSVNRATYQPKKFETNALRSTNLSVTWDETPRERIDWFQKGFEVSDFDKEIDQEMLRKYVAFSSSESESDNGRDPQDKKKLTSEQARSLLLGDGTAPTVAPSGDGNTTDEENQRYVDGPGAIVSSGDEDSGDTSSEEEVEKKPRGFQRGTGDSKSKKKQKRRQLLKEKMKKKKEKDEMISKLWDVEDDRFDEFLSNPIFNISSAHPDFKEARDFLTYIKSRKKNTEEVGE